jgi:hypothetical protein
MVERSRAPSAIYWGAYEEGPQTYGYLYDGTWNTAPWDCAYSTPRCASQDRFASHAGKEPSFVHWGAGAPWTTTSTTGSARSTLSRREVT